MNVNECMHGLTVLLCVCLLYVYVVIFGSVDLFAGWSSLHSQKEPLHCNFFKLLSKS